MRKNSINLANDINNQVEIAERAVITCMLHDASVLEDAITKLESTDFANIKYRFIFEAISSIFNDSNFPVSPLTVIEYISRNQEIKNNFSEYEIVINGLSAEYTSSANVAFDIDLVKEASIKRQLNRLCNEIIETDIDFTNFESQIIDFQNRLIDISSSKKTNQISKISEVVEAFEKHLTLLKTRDNSKLTGTDTGFKKINKVTDGFQPGDLIILAARPGTGKTAIALNFILNAAKSIKQSGNSKDTVVLFSLEMGSEQILERMTAHEAKVDISTIRNGRFDYVQEASIFNALSEIKTLPIQIHDASDVTINEIQSKLKQLKQTNNIKLVVVDYLQLLKSGNKALSGNRQQEVSTISRTLKVIARNLNTPIIALAQLSRKIEERGKTSDGENPKPMLSDLRESGSIEQDADLVTFLYQKFDDVKNDDDKEKINSEQDPTMSTNIQFLIAKHRNGSTAEIDLIFTKAFGEFSEIESSDFKGKN